MKKRPKKGQNMEIDPEAVNCSVYVTEKIDITDDANDVSVKTVYAYKQSRIKCKLVPFLKYS